jgi:multiple sugar transport system substrate-binding protein
MSGLALTGCGSSGGGAAPVAAVGYDKGAPSVTIDFWYMPYGGPIQDEAVKKETDAFHETHPNITVRPVRVLWNDALTRLSTATTSGEGPDVAQMGTTWVGGFAALDALRPYPEAELAALGGQAAFIPASWTSTHLLGSPQITAVPWLIDIRALYYRTDVLRRAGLDPARAFADWATFEATLARIKSAGGGIPPLIIGIRSNFGAVHNLAPFIWEAGGDLLSADGTQPAIAEPAATAGVAYYQRLLAAYNSPQAAQVDLLDAPSAFAAGVGAITMYNSQSIPDYQANPKRPGLKGGWATAPLPAGPKGRFGFVGGANLAIWKTTKHPDAAFEWVRYLTGKESQTRFAVGSGLWPARADAVAGTRLVTDPAYAAFAAMLADGREYPPVAAWINVETVLAKDLAPLWAAHAPTGRSQLRKVLTETANHMRTAMQP